MIAKCKARYVKLTQMLIRMRRIELAPQMDLVRYHKKTERREAARAQKAEAVAMIDQTIKKELFSRLLKGTYPTEMIDLDKGVKELVEKHLKGTLPTEEEQREQEREKELEMEQDIDDMHTEYVEGDFESDADDDDYNETEGTSGDIPDLEDLVPSAKKRRKDTTSSSSSSSSAAAAKKKKKPTKKTRGSHVEIEYEQERDTTSEEQRQ